MDAVSMVNAYVGQVQARLQYRAAGVLLRTAEQTTPSNDLLNSVRQSVANAGQQLNAAATAVTELTTGIDTYA
jgi:hypothetical protein